MKHQVVLTSKAQKDLRKVPPHIAKQLRDKIAFFVNAPDPMSFAKLLVNLPPATHRFRWRKWRIKFFRRGGIFYPSTKKTTGSTRG